MGSGQISVSVAQILAWTLIHSVWQGLVALLLSHYNPCKSGRVVQIQRHVFDAPLRGLPDAELLRRGKNRTVLSSDSVRPAGAIP